MNVRFCWRYEPFLFLSFSLQGQLWNTPFCGGLVVVVVVVVLVAVQW